MEKRLSGKKRLFLAGALAFAAVALFVLFGGAGETRVYADEILYSGTSGDLDWSITESGVLTIEGTGDYDSSRPEWVSYSDYITSAVVNVDGITDTSYMFYSCTNLQKIDLTGLDTSLVTNMQAMFDYCRGLEELDVSGFDTSNVTNMSWMFYCCSSLSELDVSGFDTSNVTSMVMMFYDCRGVAELNLSSFDTKKVTDMSTMFYWCAGLTELDLSGFDTENVTDMGNMFANCRNLISVDLSSFDTDQVTDMSRMFVNCVSLTNLNLSMFDFSGIISEEDVDDIFSGCTDLETLQIPGNIPFSMELPSVSGYHWEDANASVCTAVTAGLSTSMTYYRYADNEEATAAETTTTTTQSQTTTQPQTTTQSQTTTTQAATTTTQSQTTITQSPTTTTGQSTTSQATSTTTEEPTVIVSDEDIDLDQSVEDDTEVDINLAIPVLTCAANETEGVLVNWETVEGATSYRVYRQTGSGGWEAVADTANVTYTDTTAESGSVCAYTVCAILADGDNEQRSESGSGKSTVRLETPALTGVTRDGQDTAKLTVRWQGAGIVTGYQVQYSTDASFEEGTITLTVEGQSANAEEILTAEGSVYVRVRAYMVTTSGAKYFSDWSEAAAG